MKPITEINDPRLVKGLAHPLRIHILRVLQDRVASPSGIADELDAPLGNVSYHVRFLARVGLIELASTQPRRGAVEHYYRAVGRAQISDRAWGQVPKMVKDAVIGSALDEAGAMIGAAAQAGGFDRGDVHVSRTTYTYDEQGFSELAAAMAELQERAQLLEQESRARLAAADHAGGELDAGVVMMLFEGGRAQITSADGHGDGKAPGRRTRSRQPSKTS
ncbi:MAG: ArsR/SmtB family transcription factor [Solirubrobacteraceae bacterium]